MAIPAVEWADANDEGGTSVKKFLALLLSLCLAAPAALAQEMSFAEVYPLVNMTATAVMLSGEQLAPDLPMSDTLVRHLLAAGLRQVAGFTAFDVNNIAWRDSYLTAMFAAPHPEVTGEIIQPENTAYYGVRPMAVDESEDGAAVRILGDVYQAADYLEKLTDEQYSQVQWLDTRAVVELRRSTDAPGGWQVYSFALDAEWEMEQAARDYFDAAMTEYVNTEWGFSIQYPAVFDETCITVDQNGISGMMDGASFSVTRIPNGDGWTTWMLLESKKQETPAAETNINDITGCGCLTIHEDGQVRVVMLTVTEEYIYQAELCYQQSLAKDFSLYKDYMLNSFTVDELGLG